MYELLKTSAQNIHSESDWAIVFTILECVGAGAMPPDFGDELSNGKKSDGAVSSEEDSGLPDRGYTSDSELISKSPLLTPTGENRIIVNKKNDKISTWKSQGKVMENYMKVRENFVNFQFCSEMKAVN